MQFGAYNNLNVYAQLFKILSIPLRLKIIWILRKAKKPLCVCEIMDILKISHYNASRHLRRLKKLNLVKEKKEGKWVFYSLNQDENPFIKNLLKAIEKLPKEFFKEEEENLKKRLSLRKKGKVVIGLNLKRGRKK